MNTTIRRGVAAALAPFAVAAVIGPSAVAAGPQHAKCAAANSAADYVLFARPKPPGPTESDIEACVERKVNDCKSDPTVHNKSACTSEDLKRIWRFFCGVGVYSAAPGVALPVAPGVTPPVAPGTTRPVAPPAQGIAPPPPPVQGSRPS